MPSDSDDGRSMPRSRWEIEGKRIVRRWVTLLIIAALILVAVAVAGRLLGPARSEGEGLANDEFGACLSCVEYLEEQITLPEGAILPSCLLEVDALYRGEGLYEVRGSYSHTPAPGDTEIREYRCETRRFEDASWVIVDFTLQN